MSRLITASILPDLTPSGDVQVEFQFERPAIALKDWKALHEALCDKTIPMTRHTEIRSYASQELAELAIDRMRPKVMA